MYADDQTKKEVEAVITKMTEAYKARKISDMMACFAPDDDVVLIGTGMDEKRIGSEQIRMQAERDCSQTDSIEMSVVPKTISAAGSVAWAFCDGTFNIQAGGQAIKLPARVSLVLEKRGSKWLIEHAHFSTPAAGVEEGSSI